LIILRRCSGRPRRRPRRRSVLNHKDFHTFFQIRDQRLYRETHRSFAAYFHDKWGYVRRLCRIFRASELNWSPPIPPGDLAGAALAVFGSHGEWRDKRDFRKVSDQRNHLAPVEVAELMREYGCVVLLICHSGRRDVPEHTAETRSLVTALFAAGVRAVIACPWGLTVSTAGCPFS
jgi:hypothetical protein